MWKWTGESWKLMRCPVSHLWGSAHMQFSFSISQRCLCEKEKHHRDQTHMGVKSQSQSQVHRVSKRRLAVQHEWWFSRSSFRWREQEVSAGWFSASISYNRGHFSPHTVTYEGHSGCFHFHFIVSNSGWSFPLSAVEAVADVHRRTPGIASAKGAFSEWQCHALCKDRGDSLIPLQFPGRSIEGLAFCDLRRDSHTYVGGLFRLGDLAKSMSVEAQCQGLLSLIDRQQ